MKKRQTKFPTLLVFFLLLSFHIFFRFSDLEARASLGWDQIDSAWAAKSIVVDKHLVVNGPVAKGNTGIYMGPLYYYLIAIVYYFTGMDPIASPIFGAITATVSAIVVYWVTKKLFGERVALIALFINTFSMNVIHRDHIQNAIQFIVPVSYLIFYFLYRVITDSPRHLVYLGIMIGLSFHVDFTSVFYPMFVLLALPFFPRSKKSIPYYALSLVLFLLLVSPILVVSGGSQNSLGTNLLSLFGTYYHGFHLQRAWQLVHDAFISIENILQFKFFRPYVFFLVPVFAALYYRNNKKKDALKLFYLIALWFVIPWLVLSTYKGELTSSYFSLPYDISIAMLAYLTWQIMSARTMFFRLVPVALWAWYAVVNTQTFISTVSGTMPKQRQDVLNAIARKQVIEFKDSHADSFLYYYYTSIRNLVK
ncbi:MAG TPA: glycosyltransferase family 39 protein [Patescibacteria group bacterium]|nr:glycosyltransferase family 39 protein [Patescibacteria group bacterium]